MSATTEPEITAPVDLATPDGRRLNPAAKGWSRRPRHRANLRGSWGRNKRWDYWALLAGDLVVSSVYADVDYVGMADVWWADLATGATGGRAATVPGASGLSLPEHPGTAPLTYSNKTLDLSITDDGAGTRLVATWSEKDGRRGSLDVLVELPEDHESMNVVIPWSAKRFQYTSKHQARPARGWMHIGDRSWTIGGDGGDAWGVLDVGRGRWRYRTSWNWGGGAGTADGGATIGLQLGGKWTEGTGFTENGFLVDGRLTKIGSELQWDYRWDDPLHPWHVEDPTGHLSLELLPRYDKHTKIEAGLIGTETHQVFGTWSGTVTDGGGATHTFHDLQGFAEESRWRW